MSTEPTIAIAPPQHTPQIGELLLYGVTNSDGTPHVGMHPFCVQHGVAERVLGGGIMRPVEWDGVSDGYMAPTYAMFPCGIGKRVTLADGTSVVRVVESVISFYQKCEDGTMTDPVLKTYPRPFGSYTRRALGEQTVIIIPGLEKRLWPKRPEEHVIVTTGKSYSCGHLARHLIHAWAEMEESVQVKELDQFARDMNKLGWYRGQIFRQAMLNTGATTGEPFAWPTNLFPEPTQVERGSYKPNARLHEALCNEIYRWSIRTYGIDRIESYAK